MKIGSFVGKESVSLSSAEVDYVKNKILESGIIDGECRLVTNKSQDNWGVLFKIEGFKEASFRDRSGNTYVPKHIKIRVYRSRGYDEKVHGRSYEWEEGFVPPYDLTSYSCTIDLIGHYRRYRGKNIEYWVGITKTNYSYGTEMSDLTITEGINDINNYINGSTVNDKTPIE